METPNRTPEEIDRAKENMRDEDFSVFLRTIQELHIAELEDTLNSEIPVVDPYGYSID